MGTQTAMKTQSQEDGYKHDAEVLFGQIRERLVPVERWVRARYEAHPVLFIASVVTVGVFALRLLRRR